MQLPLISRTHVFKLGLRSRKGYVMIATALSLSFLMGAVGLGVDIGRMYIAKSEAQAYVDAGALSAARYLDGTDAGITKAKSAIAADGGKWRFDTSTFTDVTTTFATSPTGPWTASPSPATGYNYVQVVASVNLPMYLIRILSGPSATIAAGAVAGRTQITTMRWGAFPFSPLTRKGTYTDSDGKTYTAQPDDATDPFGYKIGNEYTLRWGSPAIRTNCPDTNTDAGTTDGNPNQPLVSTGDVRGYCCVSESGASLRQAIVGGDTDPETIGNNVAMESGAKNTELSAIGWRSAQDSDPTSSTYSEYVANGTGNGARVVVVPVNSGWPTNYQLVGFAAFFLLNTSYYNSLHGNDSACAIYIGQWTTGSLPAPPGSGSGAYALRLFQ